MKVEATTDAERALAIPIPKKEADEPPQQNVFHTRRCNKRKICSCQLRVESALFLKELGKKVKRNVGFVKRTKGKAVVRKLDHFEFSCKSLIAKYLKATDLAALSMVSRQWREDVDAIVERTSKDFVADESRKGKLLKVEKREHQPWSQYFHTQMNCVHKLFVHYTGYKTGEMRKSTPQWAFGEVLIDPNEPSRTILPNSWSFHGHNPWIQQKSNGKGGEWRLLTPYKFGRAPKDFVRKVNAWVGTIRPGSFLAVSFQHDAASEVTWWEAQVWYVWRADGREDDAIVYDAENDQEYSVHPRNLQDYFLRNPEHVVDVCETPRTVCRTCVKRGFNFYQCHVVKGHPMK